MSKLPWFRLYARMIDDDKLRLLAFEDRWHFVALLCLKSDGLLDDERGDLWERRLALKLGVQARELDEIKRRLSEVELIDCEWNPVKWEELQQRSDNSAARVRKHRAKRKKMGLQAQWQPSPDLRKSIYERDGSKCVYCGSADDLTLDHKTPEARGGDNSLENLQTCCRMCNASKRDQTHEEFVERNSPLPVTVKKRPRVDKSREDTEVLEPKGSCASGDALKVEHVIEIWNEVAPRISRPCVRDITPERRQLTKARIAQYSMEDFGAVFSKIEASEFLRGDKSWKGVTFDWVMKKGNFQKIIEGNYDD